MPARPPPPTALAVLVAIVAPLPLAGVASAADAVSDLLVVLGEDGRPRLVQHTLSSEGALVRLELPADASAEPARFAGPERATFAEAHRHAPGRIVLWSGSAIVRHAVSPATIAPRGEATDTFAMRAPSIPDGLGVEDGERLVSRTTWVFPDAVEIVSFTSAAGASGRWSANGAVLSFEQDGGEPTPLEVTWRARPPFASDTGGGGLDRATVLPSAEGSPDAAANPSLAPLPNGVAVPPDGLAASPHEPGACADRRETEEICAPDADADGVPDHRDVCLPADARPAPAAALPDAARGPDVDDPTIRPDPVPARASAHAPVDALGCEVPAYDARPARVLEGIVFPAGRSYLDVGARALLDRLARALEHVAEGTWEIAAHTDGAGSRTRNLRLSETRASAVRHYLMLRGVPPNRLRARGYGETRPIGDDRTEAGRRANRRVEIERID